MPWPTWDQAALAAVLSTLLWLALRRFRRGRSVYVEPVAAEFALISALYSLWRLARMLPIASTQGALERAHHIAAFEQFLHLPAEVTLQRFIIEHERWGDVVTWYYATVHVPALIFFLIWLFFRHRDRYPHWRNGLVFVTAGCLVIRFIRVAPPRFLSDLGYVNLNDRFGPSVYSGDVASGLSDQFAAMPSIHVAWAAVVSFGIVAASTSRWRWLFLPHVAITVLVVAATGHHWWMDGVVALLLLAAGLALDTAVRRRFGSPTDTAEEPASVDAADRTLTRGTP